MNKETLLRICKYSWIYIITKNSERQRDLKTKEVNVLNEKFEAAKADMRLFYGFEKFDF